MLQIMNQKYQRERGATQLPTHLLLNCCTASFVQQFHWFTLHADYLSSFATTCVARNRVKLTKKTWKERTKNHAGKTLSQSDSSKMYIVMNFKMQKALQASNTKTPIKIVSVCALQCVEKWLNIKRKDSSCNWWLTRCGRAGSLPIAS